MAAKKADVKEQTKVDADGYEVLGGTGGDRFFSFAKADVGFVFVGEFIEIEKGTYGDQANFVVDGKIKTVTLTGGLKGPMSRVKMGDMVKITHLGLKDSAIPGGKAFRAFEVAVKHKQA